MTNVSIEHGPPPLREALKSAGDVIFTTDRHRIITFVNPQFERVYGYGSDEVVHHQSPELLEAKGAAHRFDDMWTTLQQGESIRGEFINRTKQGRLLVMETVVSPMRDQEGGIAGALIVQHDVSGRDRAHRGPPAAARHAVEGHFDPLTGVANRALLLERLNRAIDDARQDPHVLFAVLHLNLDDFTKMNEQYGRQVADAMLTAVARRLERSLRAEDTLARLGGDDFVVLTGDIETTLDPSRLAERLLRVLAQPFAVHGHEVHLGASVGITTSARPFVSADDLLNNAEAAMYAAKHVKKGGYAIFEDDMAVHVRQQPRSPDALDAAHQAVAEMRAAVKGRDFRRGVRAFVDILKSISERRTETMAPERLDDLIALSEDAAEIIDRRIETGDDRWLLQQDLAAAIYDISNEVEKVRPLVPARKDV